MRSSGLAMAALLVWFADLGVRGAETVTAEEKAQSAGQQLYDPAPKEDVQAVQGFWVRTERAGLLGKRRITKEIRGDEETVTYFDSIGGVERAHTVKVDLRRAGPIRVFTYSQQRFTAGPNQGAATPGTGAYIYKIVGDQFIEIWGVLENDDRDLEVMRWQRATQ